MTSASFASLSGSTFDRLARKRQALVAARRAVDEFEAADPCARRCRCDRRPTLLALIAAESQALADLKVAEESWREYCSIRSDERSAAWL